MGNAEVSRSHSGCPWQRRAESIKPEIQQNHMSRKGREKDLEGQMIMSFDSPNHLLREGVKVESHPSRKQDCMAWAIVSSRRDLGTSNLTSIRVFSPARR